MQYGARKLKPFKPRFCSIYGLKLLRIDWGFTLSRYLKLVKKHGVEISQPGLGPNVGLTWQMTKRKGDGEVHKAIEEKPRWCPDPQFPPCAGFIEIMAPVFSNKAWRCVWHMIQNDLVYGWGHDFALRMWVEVLSLLS
uniref:Uncharacterized protein n=1 Tax=Chenopodium quinoa TaxID=63459 RepID=A0A803NE30_CHEQI